jgi:hypothetical protein
MRLTCAPQNIASGLSFRSPGTNSTWRGSDRQAGAATLVPFHDVVLHCSPRSAVYCTTSSRLPGWGDVPRAYGGGKPVPVQTAGAVPRSGTRRRNGPTGPRESRPSCCRDCLTGARCSRRSHLPRSSGGTARAGGSSGGGGPARPAANSGRPPAADRHHGTGEPDLGRGADRERTASEARARGFAAHRRAVSPARAAGPRRTAVPALGDVCSESCARGPGL